MNDTIKIISHSRYQNCIQICGSLKETYKLTINSIIELKIFYRLFTIREVDAIPEDYDKSPASYTKSVIYINPVIYRNGLKLTIPSKFMKTHKLSAGLELEINNEKDYLYMSYKFPPIPGQKKVIDPIEEALIQLNQATKAIEKMKKLQA